MWDASLHWNILWLTNLQVNTPAAEVLYTVIQEWAQLDGGSTVLDVCCGTGTIGLALAPVSLPALGKTTLPCYHKPSLKAKATTLFLI